MRFPGLQMNRPVAHVPTEHRYLHLRFNFVSVLLTFISVTRLICGLAVVRV